MTTQAKRILVVDDAATVRMYHRSILESVNFEVDEAVNGIEALEKSLEQPYDLYLVDVNMPLQDGYGFLRELRGQDVEQNPAVIISTEAEEADRQKAYVAGANLYMVKPIKPDVLISTCSLLLGEAGQRA